MNEYAIPDEVGQAPGTYMVCTFQDKKYLMDLICVPPFCSRASF